MRGAAPLSLPHSALHLYQFIFPVFYSLWLPCPVWLNRMALGFKVFCLGFEAAGVFLVELPFSLQRPPVRRGIFVTLSDILDGRTGRDAGKDAGGYRSAEGGVIFSGHCRAYLINRDELPRRYAFHEGVHL